MDDVMACHSRIRIYTYLFLRWVHQIVVTPSSTVAVGVTLWLWPLTMFFFTLDSKWTFCQMSWNSLKAFLRYYIPNKVEIDRQTDTGRQAGRQADLSTFIQNSNTLCCQRKPLLSHDKTSLFAISSFSCISFCPSLCLFDWLTDWKRIFLQKCKWHILQSDI